MALTDAQRDLYNARRRAERKPPTPEERARKTAYDRARWEQRAPAARVTPKPRTRKPLTPEQRERYREAEQRYRAKRAVESPGYRTPAQAQKAEAAKPPSADMLREQAAFEKVIRRAIVKGTVERGRWYSETGDTEEILLKFDANPPSFREGRQVFILPKKDDLKVARV